MSVSTFMVSTSPLTPPPGCGCGCDPVCCLCLVDICLNFTCPDWASWGCTSNFPFFPSGSGIEFTLPRVSSGVACEGGSTGYTFQFGTVGGNNSCSGSVACNGDGTSATVTIEFHVLCFLSPTGSFQVKYTSTFTVGITAGTTCARINTTTVSASASLDFGTPPGSLSAASLTVSSDPCGTVLAANPTAVRSSIPLPCVYLSKEPLMPKEAFELGLSPLRSWRQCSQGFGVKGSDGSGYICGCAPWPNGGCTGCDSYNADVSQSPDEVESGESNEA